MQTPGVSIVICARNEAANLEQNLPKVLEQQYPLFEVLVVDDASTDATPEVLGRLGDIYPHLNIVRIAEKTHPGKKQALQTGVRHSRFDTLLLTDADCMPAGPLWAATMMQAFDQHPDIEMVLGYGPYRRRPGLLNAWVRWETIGTAFRYATLAQLGRPYMGVGRNIAWKKDLFIRTGGFDTHTQLASGDDDLFVNAAATGCNTAVCMQPQALVFSEAPSDWAAWHRQKRRHLSTGTAYRKMDQLILLGMAFFPVQYYLLLGLLILTHFNPQYVLYLYCLRLVSVVLTYNNLISKTNENDLYKWIPVLDVLIVVYYSIYVPFALITKVQKHPWK